MRTIADKLCADADVAVEAVAEARTVLRVTILEQHALLQLLATLSDRMQERCAELRTKAVELETAAALARAGFAP